MLSPPFPVVNDQVLCFADVEGEVVLAPHCLIAVGDQSYQRRVVSKCVPQVCASFLS